MRKHHLTGLVMMVRIGGVVGMVAHTNAQAWTLIATARLKKTLWSVFFSVIVELPGGVLFAPICVTVNASACAAGEIGVLVTGDI